GYAPGRKDSGSFKHTAGPKNVGGGGGSGGGPKPHEHQASEAPHYPPHYDGYHHVSQAPPAMAMPGMGAQQPQPQPQPQQAPHPHYGNNPYRNQGHSHVRPPPHSQGPYKPQAGVHYAPHHMGGQPMGYGMAAPGQPPMQAQIMSTQPGMPPMAGWMAPHQYGYMPMAGPPGPVPGPGFDPYFHRGSPGAGGPPHSMYGVPGYSMAGASHGVASQMGAPGIMQGPMGGAPMPGMTASPMGGAQQQHHSHHHGGGGPGGLSASAQTFIPGRRPVRIVNPNTNEEVDISQQRLRSVSTASSTPQHAASGTASPAPGPTADRREPGEAAAPADDDSTPKFKIPSARKVVNIIPSARKVVNIVNPNLLPKAPKQPLLAPEPAPEATTEATTPPVPEPTKQPEEAPAAAAEPMDIDEKEVAVSEATISEASISEAAVSEAVVSEAAVSEAVEVADLAESLVKTTLTESESPAKYESLAESEPPAESLTESAPLAEAAVPENAEPAKADEEEEEEEAEEEVEAEDEVEEEEDEVETEDLGESATEEGEIDDDQLEPPPSATRSRQVTFSEPAPATRRTLTASEIVALYDGGGSVPAVVGEILRYPRVFLDRFSALREAPANFHFEIINTDDRRPADRGSGMRRSASGSSRPREAAAPQGGGFGGMGNFRSAQPPAPLGSSEERFRQSTNELRGRMDGAGASGGRGAMMGGGGRPPSGQFRGPGGGRESRGGRTGSTRGGGHEGGRGRGGGRGGRGGSQHGRGRGDAPLMDPADVKPLEKSENRYIAKALRIGKDAVEDDMLEEVFDRRMRVLLNKLTLDNFDTVSDELLAWGNKSVDETDGRVLRHLVMLVYQKAIDEPVWASMYARLCYKMFCDVDKKIEDRSLLTKDGKYLCGGFLVRKYLLTKCQEDFERGWKVEMPQDMESEEYYDAMKIKRRGLGLVRFICELFLLDILTVRIMHECVKRLLSNVETPEEEETESLAKLLTTVGKKLDKPEAKNYMDAYFVRIQAMSVNKHLPSRIRFMLKD
ncbi:hypothetical protein GGF44_002182, partial [Coemansia sp. RSA 1694]